MIPWMREKFAERKAKWEASRKRTNFSSETIGVSDRIPLRKDVSYDSIELFDECPNDVVLLTIMSYDGRLLPLRVVKTTTIKEVKYRALTELILPMNDERGNGALNYKLLKPSQNMIDLNESLSISQSNLSDCDELLLLKCVNNEELIGKQIPSGPTQIAIDKATAETNSCGEKVDSIVDINEIMLRCDVQNDIRQLLISLAKSSAFVIGAGPFAARIILMFKERLTRRNGNDLYRSDTVCLHSMSRMSETAANESGVNGFDLNGRFSKNNFLNPSAHENTKNNIEALLEIIRIYSYKHITTKTNCKEMIWKIGFSVDDVNDALKLTENNYAAACKWLMCNNKNYNDGLLKDSPMLQALITSPHIQLSFSSPKIFIAYLSILDNYSSINLWLSDAETAGVIGHVLRTYHEEKHILAINHVS